MADGFCSGTLVQTKQGPIVIENCIINDYVIYEKLPSDYVSYITSYVSDSYINIVIDDECICMSVDQKLYVVNKAAWVKASELSVFDELLCDTGAIVLIKNVELVKQSATIHILTVEPSHIFCVGNHRIVAHNVEPVSTATAAVVAVSIACPPAGVALAVGEVIACAVAGFSLYKMHKSMQKERAQNGCFSHKIDQRGLSDCKMPKIEPTKKTGCAIPVVLHTGDEIIPYQKTQEIKADCAFPVEMPENVNIHKHDVKKDDASEKDQYPGPWYNRTEDWINEHPFGQKIKKSLERSAYTNQGKRAFKVTENIKDCDGFKKGDYVVVDAMHRDHLEVFNKRGRWEQVSNFDGTKNNEKSKQGEKEFRGPFR